MRYFIATVCLLIFSLAASSQNAITPNEINISITSATSREDLAALANQLKTQGILFRYTPQFGPNRSLTGIAYRLFTTNEQLLVQCDMKDLKIQGVSAGFHLIKENGQFTVVCAGNCP